MDHVLGMDLRLYLGRIVALVTIWGAVSNADAAVRRRLTVRSNPEGALVYVDDRQVGATPVSVSFIYYGTRKIQLVKDGYKTITVKQTFSAPWYQIPPLDFFAENIYSGEARDERVVDFQLEPETIPPTNELWQRAESLRSSARSGPITALPVGIPPAAPTLSAPPAAGPGVFVNPPAAIVAPPASPPAETLPAPMTMQRLPSPQLEAIEPPGGAYRAPYPPPPPGGIPSFPPP